MKTGLSDRFCGPRTYSSGIKVPANERPHQLSATLHGFGGSPRRRACHRGADRIDARRSARYSSVSGGVAHKGPGPVKLTVR